jgi:hypothetical protein
VRDGRGTQYSRLSLDPSTDNANPHPQIYNNTSNLGSQKDETCDVYNYKLYLDGRNGINMEINYIF